MFSNPYTLIDEAQCAKDSKIWPWLFHFYKTEGIKAWTQRHTPYFWTSNCSLAKQYVSIIKTYILELEAQGKLNADHPFTIYELGAGHGNFSFYLLNELKKIENSLPCPLHFILIDGAQHNLDFWNEHHAFLPLNTTKITVSFKCMDFFNLQDYLDDFSKPLFNPAVLITNYLFDSLFNDIIAPTKTGFSHLALSIYSPKKNLKQNIPTNLEALKYQYTYGKQHIEPFYEDPFINQIITKNYFIDTTPYITIPISMTHIVNFFRNQCKQPLMMLTTDKGYCDYKYCYAPPANPEKIFGKHGSISIDVNFHFMAEYVKHLKGDAFIEDTFSHTKTAIYLTDQTDQQIPKTTQHIMDHLATSNNEILNTLSASRRNLANITFVELMSLLKLSNYDPHLFQALSKSIESHIHKLNKTKCDLLAQELLKVAKNYYFMPNNINNLFLYIGNTFYALCNFQEALTYYKHSRKYFPNSWEPIFNCGLCYYELKQYDKAQTEINLAQELGAEKKECKASLKAIKHALRTGP
jgi:hypothetical protein